MMNLQRILQNNKVILYPLKTSDFEELYAVASDPEIWEQHPNKNRWEYTVFKVFFEGAILSKGAYKIVDIHTQQCIGCTRFYDYNDKENNILIGYTFIAKAYWGKGYNLSVKKIMLDYIFKYVNRVIFHIGSQNIRSQQAILKLGAHKIDELEVAYHGEVIKLNYVYKIDKDECLIMND